MNDRCAIPGCRGGVDLVYLGFGVCAHHWDRLNAEDQPANALARALGIPVADATTTEVDMSEKKTETPKATKKAKITKPKKEKAPREPLCVFAFRLAPEERDLIHQAAGPGGASRFVKALALAGAREDEGMFRSVIREAREARS